eukprot:3508884-Rhodomonas_salina.2
MHLVLPAPLCSYTLSGTVLAKLPGYAPGRCFCTDLAHQVLFDYVLEHCCRIARILRQCYLLMRCRLLAYCMLLRLCSRSPLQNLAYAPTFLRGILY